MKAGKASLIFDIPSFLCPLSTHSYFYSYHMDSVKITCETCSCLWLFWFQRLLPSCFTCNQILSKYPLNTIFVAFYSATHLKMSLIELFASNTEGQCQQMASTRSPSVRKIFFSIYSYPLFGFSEILGLLCPGSSIWFYLHHIDFRTGRRSPKCC